MIAMGFLLGWKEEERRDERSERKDTIQEREMEQGGKETLGRKMERERDSECARERRRFARRREGRGPAESEIRGCESD